MSDIPEDVMDAARKVFAEVARTYGTPDEMADPIARAILAERERLRTLLSEAEQKLHNCETRSEMHARSFANIVDEKEKIELLVKDARAKALDEAAKVADEAAEMRERLFRENGASIDASKSAQALIIAANIRALQSEES